MYYIYLFGHNNQTLTACRQTLEGAIGTARNMLKYDYELNEKGFGECLIIPRHSGHYDVRMDNTYHGTIERYGHVDTPTQ